MNSYRGKDMIVKEKFNFFHVFLLLNIILMSGILACSRTAIRNTPMRGTTDLQGHRGARGHRPENTIPAFKYCMDQNMTTIELDTNVTKDRDLIIYHDSKINSSLCLDDTGKPARPVPVRELTVAELKKLDCGSVKNPKFPQQVPVKNTRLSTLSEFFTFVEKYRVQKGIKNPPDFNIELKFDEIYTDPEIKEGASLMVREIEKAGMVKRSTVQCFVIDFLPEIKKLNSNIATSALFQPTYLQGFLMMLGLNANRKAILEKTLAAGADIISPYYLYVTPRFVQECHSKNIRVIPWTVNDEKTMRKMLDCGVDGIISDYPDLLFRVNSEWEKTSRR